MRECWSDDPTARLSALRVKKTLSKLLSAVALEKKELNGYNLSQYSGLTASEMDKFADIFSYGSGSGTCSTSVSHSGKRSLPSAIYVA